MAEERGSWDGIARGVGEALLVAVIVVGTGIVLFELGVVAPTPLTERALVVMAALGGVVVGATRRRRASQR